MILKYETKNGPPFLWHLSEDLLAFGCKDNGIIDFEIDHDINAAVILSTFTASVSSLPSILKSKRIVSCHYLKLYLRNTKNGGYKSSVK